MNTTKELKFAIKSHLEAVKSLTQILQERYNAIIDKTGGNLPDDDIVYEISNDADLNEAFGLVYETFYRHN